MDRILVRLAIFTIIFGLLTIIGMYSVLIYNHYATYIYIVEESSSLLILWAICLCVSGMITMLITEVIDD